MRIKNWVVALGATFATAVAFMCESDIYLFMGIYCAGASTAMAALFIANDTEDNDDTGTNVRQDP